MEGVWKVHARCLEGGGKVSCWPLFVSVWRVSEGCLEGVWRVSGTCLDGVLRVSWRVSGGCLEVVRNPIFLTQIWG